MPDENDSRDPRWFLQRMPPKQVLDDVLQGDPVARLMGVAKDRAIANPGLNAVPRKDADEAAIAAALTLATATAKRMADEGENIKLTEDEKAALDLFILLVARPAIFVQGGKVAERPENWPELGRDEDLIPRIVAGVGRIETASQVKLGTGFIVGERRIVTNNHVLCALFGKALTYWQVKPTEFAQQCDIKSKSWSEDPNTAPRFELRGEFGSTASTKVRLKRVLGHHLQVDMAVLELDEEPAGSRKLPLMNEEPANFKDRHIYAVGYPVSDSQDNWGRPTTPPRVFQRVFGTDSESLGTKRFSPGVVLGWQTANAFNHDASTLPGSSGSCIVDFEQRRVVGLHYGGLYKMERNFAVPLWKFRDDPVLAGNGVNFD